MNRYLTGILALVLISAGGMWLLAIRPAEDVALSRTSSPQKEESPAIVALPFVAEQPSETPPATQNQDALLQAPDESKPLPRPSANQVPFNTAPSAKGSSPYAQIKIPVGEPIPELFPYQTERDEISRLASTYDAKKIPAIAAFLGHKDSSVREAARQGLIQLGEEKAVPVLKNAAKNAPTPEEAALLTEAAEFLALPSFVDVVFPKQSAQKS